MTNPLFEQFNGINKNQFVNELNKLKSRGGDPNVMIQNLLNSGKITQAQYNNAVNKAQRIMQMLTPSVRW